MDRLLITVLPVIFVWGMAAHALLTGTLTMRGRFSRAERPGTYWFGIALYIGLGIFLLIRALLRSG